MLWDRRERWSGVLLVMVFFCFVFVFFVGFGAVGFVAMDLVVASFKLCVGYFLEDFFLAVGGVETT